MLKKVNLGVLMLMILGFSACNLTVTVSENVPSVPTGLTATYWGSSVYLDWTDVDLNNFFGSYDIFRGSEVNHLSFLTNVPYSYAYDHSPLSGTNVYAVRGTNSAGVSGLSATATIYLSTEIELIIDGSTYSGNLTSISQQDFYYFTVTDASKSYDITFKDKDSSGSSETGQIKVSVYEENSTNAYFQDQYTDPAQSSTTLAYTPSSTGKVYIKIVPYSADSSSLGTYQIIVRTGI